MPDKVSLTDAGVRALKVPSTGQITVWDTQSPLGVRVSQGGTKTFVVMIGSGKRHTIGKVGVVKLVEAREEARRLIAAKTLKMLQPKQSSISFETALPLFLEQNYRGKSVRSKSEAKRTLESRFAPHLGKKQLHEITDEDISKELAKLDHVPSEQLHSFRFLRTFFKWCTRPPRKFLARSPLEGYEPPGQDVKRSRVLTDAELVAIWNACDGMFGDMVRLLILWGTRNGETGRLRRSWVEGTLLTIPGQCTKNKRAHSIPLLPMALAILKRQDRLGDTCRDNTSDYYFPGKTPKSHFKDGSWGKFKQELEKAAGVSNWQLRDIRRTARSNWAKLGIRRELAELLLNHVTGSNKNELDEIYDRYDYLDEKHAALKEWEAHIKLLLRTNAKLAV
ncbi:MULTISPECIES: site-specific integrase [unclassified Bradyrhizobium]|uniref:site-specific integrase n=1 Tax=unclassified Bradyrhizobium TaxID=2631580 RepID=UPI002916212B|nr:MULTISPECIES: site-specific integrase [unclassified Bradyrhizobium]